jgi:hypothetical protein
MLEEETETLTEQLINYFSKVQLKGDGGRKMKELIHKTISGIDPYKKVVSIEESEERCHMQIKRIWTCKYYVREQYMSRSERDIQKWISAFQENNPNSKHCHILRQKDSKTGHSKVVCKTLGDFFVVNGLNVSRIVYLNQLKIDYEKSE